MTDHCFPFLAESPVVALTLMPPDRTLSGPCVRQETFWIDTGFSDYLQLDWDTFSILDLQFYTVGTVTSDLADGSKITDLLGRVRVIVQECKIDTIVRCVTNPQYGEDLRLFGSKFLNECSAVIDYSQQHTELSTR